MTRLRGRDNAMVKANHQSMAYLALALKTKELLRLLT